MTWKTQGSRERFISVAAATRGASPRLAITRKIFSRRGRQRTTPRHCLARKYKSQRGFSAMKHCALDFRSVRETSTRARFKRGVIHLYNMVVCATGCNPLAYKGYGCYCGFLGSGYVIDGIDQYVRLREEKRNSRLVESRCRLISICENGLFQVLQDARLVLRRHGMPHVLGVLRTVLLEMLSRLQTRLRFVSFAQYSVSPRDLNNWIGVK